MNKNILAAISFIFIFFLVFPETSLAQNFRSGENTTLGSNETINKDFFASGERVTVAGVVNGDAYLAGGTLVINGTINGDLLAAGGSIEVNGSVTGDVRVAGGNITITGNVGRNLTVAGGNISLSPQSVVRGSLTAVGGNFSLQGPVEKDITMAGGELSLGSSVGGDVNAAVGQMILNPRSNVAGNLRYWSENDLVQNSEASVSGTITKQAPPRGDVDEEELEAVGKGFITMFKILSFLTALSFGLLILRFLPVFSTKVADTIKTRPLLSLGIGFLALAATPILVVLLLFTVVGIPLAILALFALIFYLWLSKIFVAMVTGRFLADYLDRKTNVYLAFTLGLLAYYLITLIPIIGGIAGFVSGLMGLGAIVMMKREYFQQLRSKKII